MSTRSPTATVAATPRFALSVDDAAASLGIGRAHLYVLMGDGRLAYVKLGRRRLVRPAALTAMLDALA